MSAATAAPRAAAASLTAETALFARAAGYALEGLAEVTDADLDRATPCGDWPLRTLLVHLAAAADALTHLALTGQPTEPARPVTDEVHSAGHLTALARGRVLHLLDVLTTATVARGPGSTASASAAAGTPGAPVAVGVRAAARGGAIELTVHGWDVARACGSQRTMPPALATAVLEAAVELVDDAARLHLFAAPLDPAPNASPEEHLVAFLGRRTAGPEGSAVSEQRPSFTGGRNIAVKVPPHQWEGTVAFYRDVLRLEELNPVDSDPPSVGFTFGVNHLWIDRVRTATQAELWLQVTTEDTAAAARHLTAAGVVRCDDVEPLPAGSQGFWVTSPAAVVHLVSPPDAD